MSKSIGNYEPKFLLPRKGPGEEGKIILFKVNNSIMSLFSSIDKKKGEPVILTAAEESAAEQTIAHYGFNMVASDKISLDRRIKDTRPAE